MEFVGEVFADFLGLNQSKFQWIIDQKEREEEERRERRARRARQREEAAAAAAAGAASAADALEAGGGSRQAAPGPTLGAVGALEARDPQQGEGESKARDRARRAASPPRAVEAVHDAGGDVPR